MLHLLLLGPILFSAGTPLTADLVYRHEVETCSTADSLKSQVRQLLAVDPFQDRAPQIILVTVNPLGTGLKAMVSFANKQRNTTGLRVIEHPSNDCQELERSLALTISILLDPLGLYSTSNQSISHGQPMAIAMSPTLHWGGQPGLAYGLEITGSLPAGSLNLDLRLERTLYASDNAAEGQIRSTSLGIGLALCGKVLDWMPCMTSGLTQTEFLSLGFPTDSRSTLTDAHVGVRLAYHLDLTDQITLEPWLEGRWHTPTRNLLVDDEILWTSRPTSLRFGLAGRFAIGDP
jgi:hypothetical protein